MRHIIWLMLLTISPLTISQTTVSRGIPSKLISRETPKRVEGRIPEILAYFPCPVAKTGKNIKWEESDDGDLQIGVKWPVPRFTDNEDGTVTDNLTGLMLMQDLNVIENLYPWLSVGENLWAEGGVSWQDALNFVKKVNKGVYDCNLGTIYQDWRLPNIVELNSVISYVGTWPAISDSEGVSKCEEGLPFLSVTLPDREVGCWSSTTFVDGTDASKAYIADMSDGTIGVSGKNQPPFYFFAWLVRDAQKKSRKGYSQYPSPVRKTGQTTCYDEWGNTIPCEGTGQDGDTLSGMDWPNPRFTINRDNLTVSDNLTGLNWLRTMNPVKKYSPEFDTEHTHGDGRMCRDSTFEYLEMANNGEVQELSVYNDWRIPNVMELFSLAHHQYQNTVLSNTEGTGQAKEGDPFWDLTGHTIWSSSLDERYIEYYDETRSFTRTVNLNTGWHTEGNYNPAGAVDLKTRLVWLVRGGVIDDE